MSDLVTLMTANTTGTPHQNRSPSEDIFADFTDQDLSRLIHAAATALRVRGLPPVPASSPPPPQVLHQPCGPDMWDNAKIEQIICTGLKPQYDCTPDKLLPTLNLIHIRRRNEVWSPATHITQDAQQVDVILQFSKVRKEMVLAQAKRLWDAPNASDQSHTRGTDTYNACLFGVFLYNSLTPDFIVSLKNCIDCKYCADGPLLLFIICQHIHRNHLAFVKSIKHKIRSSTSVNHNNDVPKYLRFFHDNLKLISSTDALDKEHNVLFPHVLLQLRTMTIPVFQQSVLQWQRKYFENKLVLTHSA
jgi:hypothetical protein